MRRITVAVSGHNFNIRSVNAGVCEGFVSSQKCYKAGKSTVGTSGHQGIMRHVGESGGRQKCSASLFLEIDIIGSSLFLPSFWVLDLFSNTTILHFYFPWVMQQYNFTSWINLMH